MIDKLISYYPMFEEPLFTVKNSLNFSVEQCYKWIMKYAKIDGHDTKRAETKIKKMMSVCMDKGTQIVDEVYLTLIKMLRHNPETETIANIWEILAYMASFVLPSRHFLYPVYNWLLMVIEHHPDPLSKKWARYILKRMYLLQKNPFGRNFMLSTQEMKYIKAMKMIPMNIYLQNGEPFVIYKESYTPAEEMLDSCMDFLKIPSESRQYFCLFESVVRSGAYEEKVLPRPLLLGDILSCWEMLKNQYQDLIQSTRVYVGFKYFPLQPGLLTNAMVCSKLFNMHFRKIAHERNEASRLWALALQMYNGDYSERPGFIRDKLSLLHHSNFKKLYSDESFKESLKNEYQQLSGRNADYCAREILEMDEHEEHTSGRVFKIRFRNSNNPNFRDLHEEIIMIINNRKVEMYEEIARESILEIDITEISNWGLNKDVFVMSYGDKYETTKLYFLSHSPMELAEVLHCYTSTPPVPDFFETNPEFKHFQKNSKTRKVNSFMLK